MQKQEDRQYAGFFVRLAAYAMDSLLASLLLAFITVPMGVVKLIAGETLLTRPVLFQYSIAAILVYLIRAFYFTICTYSGGQTIGKKVFNICVVSANDEELTFLNVLYRETIGRFLSGLVLNIGYFMIGPSREKCALHDMLCDTRVIYSVYVRGMKGKPKTVASRPSNPQSPQDIQSLQNLQNSYQPPVKEENPSSDSLSLEKEKVGDTSEE